MLRAVARPVMRPGGGDVAATLAPLLREMARSLTTTNGMGLSAPQLGESLRLCMLAAGTSSHLPLTMLNPRLVRTSRDTSVGWETCLSVPDYAALVTRPRRVEAEYETLDGERVTRRLSGDAARVFQHELDHLDGILFTSRMHPGSFVHVSTLDVRENKAALEALAEAQSESQSWATTPREAPAGKRSRTNPR